MKTFFTSLRILAGSPFLGLSALLIWLSSAPASAQTITTGSINPTQYCAGAAIAIPFTVDITSGVFGAVPGPTNITYRAQLSNTSGGFGSGTTNLASIVSTVGSDQAAVVPLTINTTVPAGLPFSNQYRIRVQKIQPGANVNGSPNSNGNLIFGMLITATYPNPLGPYCVGDPISIPYVVNCPASAGNTFTLQLSNAAGSFASPTTIASVNATTSGSINGNFPNVPAGSGYQIRIVSSNPAEISNTSLPFRLGNGTLATMKVNGSVYCQGEVLNLAYAFNAADPINAGNVYSVQLSNTNFANSTTIGTLASSAKSGSIQAVIPTNIAGSNYEIRIVSSNSLIDGCEYGLYTIAALPALPTVSAGTSPVCAGDNASFTVSGTAGTTLTYTRTGLMDNQTLPLNGSNQTITASNVNANVTLTLVSVSNANCTVPLSTTATVAVTPLPTTTISYTGTPFCKTLSAVAVTLTGTNAYTGGSYSSTAGLSINPTTGEINPSTSTAGTYIVTYTTVAAGGCAPVEATTSVTITALPTANISYAGTPFCKTLTTGAVTLTGTNAYTGGTYSSTAGLSINSTTGEINPSTSTAGTYIVTYTTAVAEGCTSIQATALATITALPTATISYAGTPFCKTLSAVAVTLTGTNAYTGGSYSSTAGLSINSTTGEINPSTSTAGTYIVTYNTGGCTPVEATTSVTITALPTANISYAGSPFCNTLTTGAVTLTGTNAFTGGAFSSTAGLSINSTTGEINPSTSTAGTYIVTYTTAVAGGCTSIQATALVTITALPTANISYAGSPFCNTLTTGAVTLMGTNAYTGGSYSSTAGLTTNPITGKSIQVRVRQVLIWLLTPSQQQQAAPKCKLPLR